MLNYDKSMCTDFDDEVEVQLHKIFMALLNEVGSTYMSYTFDLKNQNRLTYRSDPLWASLYQKEMHNGRLIIEQCPLDICSRQIKNKIIVWDDFASKEQPKVFRDIMGMRTEVGLRHGLTLSTYFGHHHDALAIATENKRDNLSMRVLLEDRQILAKYLLLCRKTVIKNYLMVD